MANTLTQLRDAARPNDRATSRYRVGGNDYSSVKVVTLPANIDVSEVWVRMVGDDGWCVVGETAASPISDDDGACRLFDGAWERVLVTTTKAETSKREVLTVIADSVAGILEVEIVWRAE